MITCPTLLGYYHECYVRLTVCKKERNAAAVTDCTNSDCNDCGGGEVREGGREGEDIALTAKTTPTLTLTLCTVSTRRRTRVQQPFYLFLPGRYVCDTTAFIASRRLAFWPLQDA